MQSQNLYFLAIIPHSKVAGEITAFKEHIARHYHSRKALRVMPHITLKAPFATRPDVHMFVTTWFKDLCISVSPFTININGFECFDSPRNPVVFVKPEVSAPLLQLQKEIITGFEAAFPEIAVYATEKTFSPHLTIAYRDLAYEAFKAAWAEYKNKEYTTSFEVHVLYLLQHDGSRWNTIAEKQLL